MGRSRIRAVAEFTIVEVFLAIAVIAISVTIAIPSYQDHHRKVRPGSVQAPDGELTLDEAGAKTRAGQTGW